MPSPKEITVLQQTHRTDEVMRIFASGDWGKVKQDPALFRSFKDAAKSQCMIVKHIKAMAQKGGISVLTETFKGVDYKSRQALIIRDMKKVLDNKIPEDCNNLNFPQSFVFTNAFAAEIAVYLRIIKEVPSSYKDFEKISDYFQEEIINSNLLKRIGGGGEDSLRAQWQLNYIAQQREFLSLCQALSQKTAKVMIVYGYIHTFEVRQCLPKPIKFNMIDFSVNKPVSPVPAQVEQLIKDMTTPPINCDELRKMAIKGGYGNLFNPEGNTTPESIMPNIEPNNVLDTDNKLAVKQEPSLNSMPDPYEVNLYNTAKTTGKSFLYTFIPGLTYSLLMRKGCTHVQAKLISEVFKAVGLYLELGKIGLISPMLTSALQLAGVTPLKANVAVSIFMLSINATLFLPEMSARFSYKIATTILCNTTGSLLGYGAIKYIKKSKVKTKKLTYNDMMNSRLFKHYKFNQRTRKKINIFLKKTLGNWSTDETLEFIFKMTKYASGRMAGIFSEMFLQCLGGKIELKLKGDLCEEAGIKLKVL
jgi:hypothetical protein